MPANIVEDNSPIWLSGTGREEKNYGQVKERLLRIKPTCKMSLYTGKDDGYCLHPHLISRWRGEGRSCGIGLTLSAIQP